MSTYRLDENPHAVTLFDLFTAAVNIGLATGADVAKVVSESGGVIEDALDTFDGWANAHMHSDREVFNRWFGARSAVHFLMQDDPSAPDKFGFKASLRRDSIRDLRAAGLIK